MLKRLFTSTLVVGIIMLSTAFAPKNDGSVDESLIMYLKQNQIVVVFPTVDQVMVSTESEAPPVCFCYKWKYFDKSKMYEMHCFDSYGGALPIIYAANAAVAGSIPYTCPPGLDWPTWP